MKSTRGRLIAMVTGWVALVTALHLWFNFDWVSFNNERLPEAQRRLNVGYIPVT